MSEQSIIDNINNEIQSPDAVYRGPVEPYDAGLYARCIIRSNKNRQSNYNQTYILKHKSYLNQKIECDICYKSYQRWNKSSHVKTKYHINKFNLIKDMPDSIMAT